MQHFILMATSIRTGERLIPASELIRERGRKGIWPIGQGTANKSRLQAGDKVIFYAGSRISVFTGEAILASGCYSPSSSEYDDTKGDPDYFLNLPLRVRLTNLRLFEKKVAAKDVAGQLSFVRDPQYWGRYFQGGCRVITAKDYELIVSAG